MFPKPDKRWKNKKWTDNARDQSCTMRLPCCNGDASTTVLAHKSGAGMARKADDHDGADCCYACHMALDTYWPYPDINKQEAFEQARIETIQNRIERGVVGKNDAPMIDGILAALLNEFRL